MENLKIFDLNLEKRLKQIRDFNKFYYLEYGKLQILICKCYKKV